MLSYYKTLINLSDKAINIILNAPFIAFFPSAFSYIIGFKALLLFIL
jgi:hypothetical protein